MQFLAERRQESGIIYCLSRASVEDLADRLRLDGFEAVPYHAGLDKTSRDQHQEQFLKDDVKIVVATIAFGMGVDKSNVRYVVHMDLPKNIESYYQETGRAGRDGMPSDALLFYSYGDVMKLESFVEVDGNVEQSEIMRKKLKEMSEFGELRTCRRKFLLNYFDEEAPDNCESCDICLADNNKFDGTEIAQKALSAVKRLDEGFGMNYVVDFLRGSKSEKIRPPHKALPTYGVGDDISKEDWLQYIRDLIHLGLLRKSNGQYPVLQLTEKSIPVLKGQEKVTLIQIVDPDLLVKESVTHQSDAELFERLRALRNQTAKREGIPPYIIFSDATLHEMATFFPQTMEELARIGGFGAMKLKNYGQEFLSATVSYCEEKQLASKMHLKTGNSKSKRRSKQGSNGKSETRTTSLELFKSGKSIREIADYRNLHFNTIENHLTHFILDGTISITDLVDPPKIDNIKKAIVSEGESNALKPIKESLGEDYSYGENRAVQNYMIFMQNQG